MKRTLLVAAALGCVLTAGHWAWAQQSTVVQGDAVAAHTHPNDENVTVISGAFHVGTGQILRHTPYPPAPSSETTWHSPKLKVSVAL